MCVKIDNPDLAAPKSGVRKFSKSPNDELLPIALPDTAPPWRIQAILRLEASKAYWELPWLECMTWKPLLTYLSLPISSCHPSLNRCFNPLASINSPQPNPINRLGKPFLKKIILTCSYSILQRMEAEIADADDSLDHLHAKENDIKQRIQSVCHTEWCEVYNLGFNDHISCPDHAKLSVWF